MDYPVVQILSILSNLFRKNHTFRNPWNSRHCRSPLPGAWFSHTGCGHQHSRKSVYFWLSFFRETNKGCRISPITMWDFITSLQEIVDRANSLSAIFFAFAAVIMVTAFRGKSGSKNRQFCDCADGKVYLTITLVVMGSWCRLWFFVIKIIP